ncbi:MAG: alpha/beta hydrolase [Bacteroidales bacterium]|nr:alpha/beta hydrolase [Bacteroidales bacterium]
MKTIAIIMALCLPLVALAQNDSLTIAPAEGVDSLKVEVSEEAQPAVDPLRFDGSGGVQRTLTMPNGAEVEYMAWEGIYYVANVQDSVYQCLNFYVPVASLERGDVPILLRNNIGGYMAARPRGPSATDASGRALSEGYAVCIPGARGSNSVVATAEGDVYTGRAPAGLLDLKAIVRYLRHNDDLMAGSAELIISDGTSAGGAMSSLLGATGNHPVYEPWLKAMGAASERDDIFAAVCYCPITDLDHADMAYEWLYSCTNDGVRQLSDEQKAVSEELAAQFPAYINSLGLMAEDGTLLTDANYLDYIKGFLMQSVQRAIDEGCAIPENIGIQRFEPTGGGFGGGFGGQGGPGRPEGMGPGGQGGPRGGMPRRPSEFVADIDMPLYLSYVAATTRLKSPPAFDSQGVIDNGPSRENDVFGDSTGSSANFTEYSLRKSTGDADAVLADDLQLRVWMLNPMNFIGNEEATTAPLWYIRHGAIDRDTSFCIPVNLATKLRNCGYEVNFALPWNRPHSGDYNLNDLFRWIASILPAEE